MEWRREVQSFPPPLVFGQKDYSDKNCLESRSVFQGNCLVLHIIKSILECSYLALQIWLFSKSFEKTKKKSFNKSPKCDPFLGVYRVSPCICHELAS
jgi:hypothetical protein